MLHQTLFQFFSMLKQQITWFQPHFSYETDCMKLAVLIHTPSLSLFTCTACQWWGNVTWTDTFDACVCVCVVFQRRSSCVHAWSHIYSLQCVPLCNDVCITSTIVLIVMRTNLIISLAMLSGNLDIRLKLSLCLIKSPTQKKQQLHSNTLATTHNTLTTDTYTNNHIAT